jgi:hypothetical protein
VALALCQAPLRQWRSVASVHKVDDYPLYVMHYYGDYGFGAFLQRGITPRQEGSTQSASRSAWACSVFAALDPSTNAILGRNFDWHNRQTLLLFTDPPHGYASVSMVDVSYLGFPQDNPSWADRRALLEAPYLPFDGMNERGLAVGMMAVAHAQDSVSPEKVTISSLQAIRLMLDYAADVEEAIALLQDYTIDFGRPPIHYLIGDRSGHSAVVEYLHGEMSVLRSDQPWQVSTNFILAEQKPVGANSPCWRYNKVYDQLEEREGALSLAEAMALLEDVSQPNTVWSVVYDMTGGDIGVAMGRQYDRIHSFQLKPQTD